MRLKWKRKNESGQVMSQCGRFWFVWMDNDHSKPVTKDTTRAKGHGFVQLCHDDTRTIVGHYPTIAEAKAAAQSHLDGLKRDDRVEDSSQYLKLLKQLKVLESRHIEQPDAPMRSGPPLGGWGRDLPPPSARFTPDPK